MNTSILVGKRVALLGGIGSRSESKEALINELGLAELNWVYSERNKDKPFAVFSESVYPGKYDYIFVLTKFLSHKVWEHLKGANLGDTPIIRLNGSYNAEGFLRAMYEQLTIYEDKPEDITPAPTVVRKLLAPAEADTREPLPRPTEPEETVFHARSNEEIRLSAKVQALEARVKELQGNQQDLELLKAATDLYNGVIWFIGGYPAPSYLEQAKEQLYTSLRKHNIKVDKSSPFYGSDQKQEIMLTNIVVGELFMSLRGTINAFIEQITINKYGACIVCHKHKSIGCDEDCMVYRIKQIKVHIDKGLKIAAQPDMKTVAEFLKKTPGNL